MINPLQIGAHFGAQPALGNGVGRVGIEIDRSPRFDFRDDAAGVRTVVGTGPVNTLDGHNFPSLFVLGHHHDEGGAGKKQILAYFFPIWL
jgi:hypothetical protein